MKTKFIILFLIIGCVFVFQIHRVFASIGITTPQGTSVSGTLNVQGSIAGSIMSPGTCGAAPCPLRQILLPCNPKSTSCNGGKFQYQVLSTGLSGNFSESGLPITGCDVHCKNIQGDCCYSIDCGGHSCSARPWTYNFNFNIDVSSLSPGNYTLRLTAGCCLGGTRNDCSSGTCAADLAFTKADTTPPTCSVNYPHTPYGSLDWTNDASIPVTLTEADSGSGIDSGSGNVDRIR